MVTVSCSRTSEVSFVLTWSVQKEFCTHTHTHTHTRTHAHKSMPLVFAVLEPGSIDKLSSGPGWSACLTCFPQLCSTKEEGWNTLLPSLCRLSISGFGENTKTFTSKVTAVLHPSTLWNRLPDKLHQRSYIVYKVFGFTKQETLLPFGGS